MKADEDEADRKAIARAASGDPTAWALLQDRYRMRLRRLIDLRLDPRIRARLDPSDLVQEVFTAASQNAADFMQGGTDSPYLWLRSLALTYVAKAHRMHLTVKARDVRREIPLSQAMGINLSSLFTLHEPIDSAASPRSAVLQQELALQLTRALESLEPLDREALILRHYEELSSAETARILGISVGAAGKRYLRALTKIKAILELQDN
jgi:RNA polymerase sigma-70 factor, ECF subfamily